MAKIAKGEWSISRVKSRLQVQLRDQSKFHCKVFIKRTTLILNYRIKSLNYRQKKEFYRFNF